MLQELKIERVSKNRSCVNYLACFDSQIVVDSILKALRLERYEVSRISKILNLDVADLTSILAHARIKISDNYIYEDGIQYLVDREVGKIKRYFEQSLANFTSLSEKEQRTFNAFLNRYGIKYRKIKRWEDLKIEVIRNDCYADLTGNRVQTFYDGKFISYEEIEFYDETKASSMIQLIRSSLMYNIKNKRKWIRFKLILDTTVVYILTHHFHIFTSEDDNSIHAAKHISMFNLPQSANNYILVA